MLDDTDPGPTRLLRIAAPLAIGGGLLLAHLEVLTRGPGYAGILLPLDHLFDLSLAVAALALFAAAGLWLLAGLGLEPERAPERFLHAVATGAGIWALLFLVLGLAGALSGVWLAAGVVAGTFLLRNRLAELPPLLDAVVRDVRRRVGDRWLVAVALATTAGAAVFLLLHGSAPPGDWDSLMYHLEVPRQWLAEGRITLLEGNLHVAYTSLMQILYLPFLAVGSPAAAALLHGGFALLLGLAVFVVGERLLDEDTAAVSTALLWASGGLLMVAVTARIDTTLAFFLLLGHGAVVAALVEPARGRDHLLRAGLLLGLAVGMKYQALAYTAAVVPVGLWALWRLEETRRRTIGTLTMASLLFLGAAVPWMLKNQLLLGAPFYPFFTDRLLQPWLAALYGTTNVSAVLEGGVPAILSQSREPFDLVSFFVAPERLTVEAEAVHYHTNPLFLLLPLGLLHLRRTALTALAVPALIYAVAVTGIFSTINLRYLFPAIAPLTLAAGFLAVETLRRLGHVGVRRAVLVAATVLAVLPTVRSGISWTRRAPVVEQAFGQASRQDYLAAGFSYYAGLVGTVNRSVPEDGRVLLLWEARGFYLAPAHLPDNVLSNWPLLAPYVQETESCLERSGITHILAATAAPAYYESRGADPDALGVERFQAFADRCLEAVDGGAGHVLYAVDSEGH